MKKFKSIIALGPNPAWQKTLFFNELNFGKVNRAHDMHCFASGKGINFCRASRSWGNDNIELLQFAGGDTGELLCEYLKNEGIRNKTVRVKHPTRTCYTCLSTSKHSMTELIEPSFAIESEEMNEFHTLLKESIENCSGVSFCGTLPNGSSIEIYRRAAEIAREADLPLLIDSWQNITPVLEVGGNVIFKVNAEEIQAVANKKDTVEAIKNIIQDYKLKGVAVTDGPDTAYFAFGSQLFTYELPLLDEIVSSLGCGDTNASIFFNEYLAGTAPEKAFAHGLAAASSNCLSATCGDFSKETAAEIYEKIKINAKVL